MILPGRYMTALIPSNGLVPTVDHTPVVGSKMRVVVSGPASRTRPAASTKMKGERGEGSFEPVKSVHAFVFGSYTSGSEFTDASEKGGVAPARSWTMLSPEKTSTRPSPSSVAVGYQRPTLMFGAADQVFVLALKIDVSGMPTSATWWPPATNVRPSASSTCPAQNVFTA